MFYSEAILSRRGPLAKVWLAAHMERKLSKTQTLQTDIEQSVDAIMGQEVEVMALRLSGQLLLGVVRIYSRKAKYLLDDCNEALLKIKMAFRPGIVDMTEDQLAVNRNAITLQVGGLDLDVLLPDINWDLDFEDRPMQPQGQHVARVADITLATADDLQFDFGDPTYGLDLGPSDGIGSQDFDFDLGLDFGDGDNLSAVEMGRDAAAAPRLSDVIGDKLDADGDVDMMSNKSRDASEHPFGADLDFGGDFDGMNVDLGLDFGDNREKTPDQTRSPSRASSPLTEGPITPPPDANIIPHESATKTKRQPKPQKQIIDSVTELADGPGARLGRGRNAGLGAPMTKDVSDILTPQHFLPRSSVVMRLLEIRDDPIAHFLPTTVTKDGIFFCAAPPGLAPQLAELFMRPMLVGGHKRRGGDVDRGGNKKMRLDGETDFEDVEQGMRAASMAPSMGLGSDVLGRGSVVPGLDFGDHTAGMDDFQLGGDFDMGGRGKSAAPTDKSRMSTPPGLLDDGEETYADLACPIAMFDVRPNTQSQTQGVEKVEETRADIDGKGYSKNTVKALGVIRKELMPEVEVNDKVLSFNKMSEKASRRAAASFFFELLVLGTRDCVQISQTAPFENIEIRAKEKLWERQRHASVARSIASSMGL